MGGDKNKVINLFKINTTKNCSRGKCVRNLYDLGKKPRNWKYKNKIIRNIRNLFNLKKENEAIKDKIMRDFKTLFEQEEDFYKPVRVGNFWSYNYIEYGSNGNRNKNWKIKEYLDETILERQIISKNLILGKQQPTLFLLKTTTKSM